MSRQIIILSVIAVSYLFYHLQFFAFTENVMKIGKKHTGSVIVTFFINYVWFIAASLLKLHLIVNWTIFFFFLMIEIFIIYHTALRNSMNLAGLGIIHGLAWNIVFRCIFALILDRPLTAFDNTTSMTGNLKQYPIFIGFVATAIMFWFFNRKRFGDKIRLILQDQSSLKFSLGIQTVLYGYLALNLLGYYVPGNSVFLKFWGIKSAVFVFIGMNICNIYTVRMSKMNLYREKLKKDRIQMLAEKKQEDRIWSLAYTDSLTGCYNRHYAEQILMRYLNEKQEFCLCFVDLDCLKSVNDKFGHQEGDSYLKTVSMFLKKAVSGQKDYLFRYGGDEFLLLFSEKGIGQVLEIMQKTEQQLKHQSVLMKLPFTMSISFGVSESSEAENAEDLLKSADKRMYEHKKGKAGRRNGLKRNYI